MMVISFNCLPSVNNKILSSKNSTCDDVKRLKKILLAINFNWPIYKVIPFLEEFYGDVFGKIVFCGAVRNEQFPGIIQITENYGFLGYECLQKAIRMYPNYTGYIHSSDDVLLQWWNTMRLDFDKIWIDQDILSINLQYSYNIDTKQVMKAKRWWPSKDRLFRCQNAFSKVLNLTNTAEGMKYNFDTHVNNFFKNTNNTKLCARGRADFFYIPKHIAPSFAKMLEIYRSEEIHLEITLPSVLIFFLTKTNFHDIKGVYLPDKYWNTKYHNGKDFAEIYFRNTSFYHPFKLTWQNNLHFFKEIVMTYKELLCRDCRA